MESGETQKSGKGEEKKIDEIKGREKENPLDLLLQKKI